MRGRLPPARHRSSNPAAVPHPLSLPAPTYPSTRCQQPTLPPRTTTRHSPAPNIHSPIPNPKSEYCSCEKNTLKTISSSAEKPAFSQARWDRIPKYVTQLANLWDAIPKTPAFWRAFPHRLHAEIFSQQSHIDTRNNIPPYPTPNTQRSGRPPQGGAPYPISNNATRW
jgi:hypothetical protein